MFRHRENPGRARVSRGALLVFAVLLAASLLVTLLTIVPGRPVGIDTPGHLFKAWAFARGAERDLFSLHPWTQYWYNGHPLYYYYAPGSVFVIGALEYVIDNIEASYRVFIALAYLAAGTGAFMLARLWLGRYAALGASLFYLLAPYTMKTVFWEGHIPRTLGMAFIPFAFYVAARAVDTRRHRYFVLLPPIVAALIFSHLMPALATLALLSVFLPFYGFFRVGAWRVVAAGIAMLIGVGLAAVWMIPATSQGALPDVPNLAGLFESLSVNSTDARALLDPVRQWLSPNALPGYIGAAAAAASAAALLLWRRRRVAVALAAAATFGILLSMGSNSPIFGLVDGFDVFTHSLPSRFLQPVVLLMGILTAAAVQAVLTRRSFSPGIRFTVAIGLAVLVAADSGLFLRTTRGIAGRDSLKRDLARTAAFLREEEGAHRMFTFTALEPGTGLATAQLADRDITSGWDPQGTPHSIATGLFNRSNADSYFDWANRTLDIWDAEYALVNDIPQVRPLAEELRARGWTQADIGYEIESLGLLRRPVDPPGRIMYNPMPVATIGGGGPQVSWLSPNVGDGPGVSPFIEDQDPAYLSMFDTVVLFGHEFRSRRGAERMLTPLLDRGGTVIDAIGTGSPDLLFGATAEPRELQGKLVLRERPDARLLPGEEFEVGPFTYAGGPWTGAVITGGAEALVTTEIDGEEVAVIADKRISNGRVVYVGMSFFTQATSFDDAAVRGVIQSLLGFDARRRETPVPFPAQDFTFADDRVSFRYRTDDAASVLLSMTYFPAWRATLDGAPLPLFRHERLTLMRLPAGAHEVNMTYGMTSDQVRGAVFSLISLLAFALVIALPRIVRRLSAPAPGGRSAAYKGPLE